MLTLSTIGSHRRSWNRPHNRALLAGTTPHYLDCPASQGFKPNFSEIDDETWARVGMVYLCNPGNPHGALMTEQDLQSLIRIAKEVKPWVLEYLESMEHKYAQTTSVIPSRKIFPLVKDDLAQEGDFGYFLRMDNTFNKLRTEHWKTLNPELWNKIEPFVTADVF